MGLTGLNIRLSMKKLIFIFFALFISVIQTNAGEREVNFARTVCPYPTNIKPAELEIKGKISKLTQKRLWAKMAFGEVTKGNTVEEEIFEYQNGVLTRYYVNSEITGNFEWILKYTADKKISEAFVKSRNSEGTTSSLFIYSYSNGKLASVDERSIPEGYDPNSSLSLTPGQRISLSKLTYSGNQTHIKKYRGDGRLIYEFVYNSDHLVKYVEYLLFSDKIFCITDYNYNKLGKLIEKTDTYSDEIRKHYYKYNEKGWVNIWSDNRGWKTGFSYVIDKRANWIQKIQSSDSPNSSFYLFEREITYE